MEAQHPQRGVFDVVLLAADGREQNITLHVSPKGVTLAAMDKVGEVRNGGSRAAGVPSFRASSAAQDRRGVN